MSTVVDNLPAIARVSPANRGLVLRRAHTCVHAKGVLTGRCQLGLELPAAPIPCFAVIPGKAPAGVCPHYRAIGLNQAIRDYTPWLDEGGAS
jgi:hypothetical protein